MKMEYEKCGILQTVSTIASDNALIRTEAIKQKQDETIRLQNQRILQLQQESKKLKTEIAERIKWWHDEAKAGMKLLEENEQLEKQNTAMKDVIEDALHYWGNLSPLWKTAANQAISADTGKDYHNPADRTKIVGYEKALKQANEALEASKEYVMGHYNQVRDAIDAINAVFTGMVTRE